MNKLTNTSDPVIDCLIARKEELGMTYATIAEMSGVPESTVAKLFNRSIKSPTLDTIFPIARALDVSLDALSVAQAPKAEATVAVRDHYLTMLTECHNKHVETLEKQLAQKTKWNIAFVTMLFVTMGALIFFILYDITHPDMGWIQYSTAQAINGLNALKSSLFNL